jgi:tetratricopeptide (TPR) repeat protein
MIRAMLLLGTLAMAQEGAATLEGLVRDANGKPVAAASVSLGEGLSARTNAEGRYRFSKLGAGTYTLRAEMAGYVAVAAGPFNLGAKETKQIDLKLADAPAFFDEPNFIVAGVTDTVNRGGHGSETVVRSTEALTRAAASLADASPKSAGEAESHHSRAVAEEKRGNVLEAAREYQRAAELDASENNLFDWGTDLLTHRAAEQAIEVFAKGNRLFPGSARMLLGLGAALYARGSYDEAARRFFEAVDLNPRDPAPYVFLGRVQSVEITLLDGFFERLRRFAELAPGNALANYYYAAILWKRGQDPETAARVKPLLETAVRLNPGLGDAYFQMGMVYADLKDFPKAIAAYQKAIEAGTGDAHYRLAQAYQRSGEPVKARKEFDLYEQFRRTSAAEEERKRNEIQQFVFRLRDR